METRKVQYEFGDARTLEIYWQGDTSLEELPAGTNYIEIEAPCPDGCSWAVREATAEDFPHGIIPLGSPKMICYLEHEGAIGPFFTDQLRMSIRFPADIAQQMTLSFR